MFNIPTVKSSLCLFKSFVTCLQAVGLIRQSTFAECHYSLLLSVSIMCLNDGYRHWNVTNAGIFQQWQLQLRTWISKFYAEVALLYFHSNGANEHSHVRDQMCVKCNIHVTRLFCLTPDGQVKCACKLIFTSCKVLLDDAKRYFLYCATLNNLPFVSVSCLFDFQTYNWIWSPNNGWLWLAVLYGPHQPCWFCYCSDKEWTALLQLRSGKWRHQHNDSQ